MGCGGSKVDSLPLVNLCRERKQYIKTAREHQHTMAFAHILYFKALKEVGEILNRFVDEELMVASSSLSSSPSPMDSPILRIPSDDLKKKKTKTPSSTPLSHSPSNSHHHLSSDSEHNSSSHIHFIESPLVEEPPSPSYPHTDPWGYISPSSHVYYMKKSSTTVPSMFYEEPQPSTAEWGNFGSIRSSGNTTIESKDRQWEMPEADPPPPPSPKVSVWDFMNPFGADDNGYEYNSESRRRYGWGFSSPDSQEVREREGIPELEEEGDHEVLKEVQKESSNVNMGGYESTKEMNFQKKQDTEEHDMDSVKKVVVDMEVGDVGRNQKDVALVIDEDGEGVGIGVGIEGTSAMGADVSETGVTSSLAAHGSTNFIEAVREIRREFEAASSYGKEVADLLDVGTIPYRPKSTTVNVMFSRILYFFSSSSHHSSDDLTEHLASNIMKDKRYTSENSGIPEFNLSSTLEKLYFWESKLFKQIKEEESIRVRYERRRKKMRALSERGADSSKIDAQHASMKSLLTKLEVSVRSINGIARRIHKLRDEELHPLLHSLIQRLTVMWGEMLRCHRAQFEIIAAAKAGPIRVKTGAHGGPMGPLTPKLEAEILRWCSLLVGWVQAQKAYAESINGWLMRWLLQEPEETVDGPPPFSPGLAGAPPVFIATHDWARAMDSVWADVVGVDSSMKEFATGLHRLSESQEEEQAQWARAESLTADVMSLVGPGRAGPEDVYRKRVQLKEGRVRHREAVRVVKGAASGTVAYGLVHVLEALLGFTAQAAKAHEQVRVTKLG